MPGVAAVVDIGDPRPAADLVTSVMSLPLAFKFHPVNVPYLRVPANRDAASLGSPTKPRIGVVWSGSPHSRERSAMSAETLAPLLALPGFEFHCLQKDIAETDRIWLESARPAVNLHVRRLGDFADTAALAVQMNVIGSIDTAVAHLAGGLGRPVLVMLLFNPDWRWLLGRQDSPWYPTARLFRQPRRGAWSEVVQAVIATLAAA
jgi:ADP-heptose:LPS heptosyltransferase